MKQDLISATNILKNTASIKKALSEIAKTSGNDFAFFDETETKFVSDFMEIMIKISQLLDKAGIKYTHYYKKLNDVPDLVIDSKYMNVSHKLFNGWRSNVIVEQNTRISNFNAKDR